MNFLEECLLRDILFVSRRTGWSQVRSETFVAPHETVKREAARVFKTKNTRKIVGVSYW